MCRAWKGLKLLKWAHVTSLAHVASLQHFLQAYISPASLRLIKSLVYAMWLVHAAACTFHYVRRFPLTHMMINFVALHVVYVHQGSSATQDTIPPTRIQLIACQLVSGSVSHVPLSVTTGTTIAPRVISVIQSWLHNEHVMIDWK